MNTGTVISKKQEPEKGFNDDKWRLLLWLRLL